MQARRVPVLLAVGFAALALIAGPASAATPAPAPPAPPAPSAPKPPVAASAGQEAAEAPSPPRPPHRRVTRRRGGGRLVGHGGLPAPSGPMAATAGSWNVADQRTAVSQGFMANLADGRFHGEKPLGRTAMAVALRRLAARRGVTAIGPGTAPMTMVAFDRLLVAELGLTDVANAVQAEAARAGLRPPWYFGSEVVARELELRFNHLEGDDAVEQYPWDLISRAEAAYSVARIVGMSSWQVDAARATYSAFRLPAYSPAQREALTIAVSKIAMPYVWGGESDDTAGRWGPQAHGGYDCSGFVWRVFKGGGLPAGNRLAGRTAAQMAGEISRSARVSFDSIEAADVLFFGNASFSGVATEASVNHTGIALGGGFMIHSSRQGVYVASLSGWRRNSFTWARRIL